MSASSLVALALLCVAGAAFSADQTPKPKDGEPVIVCFGDSTTAPRGPLTVYATLIERALTERGLKPRVVNAGVGGNTTDHARARFDKDVLAQDPAIVVIQLGINDSCVDVWAKPPAEKPRVAIERYTENLRYFVSEIRRKHGRPILMTPNLMRWTPPLRDMYGKPPYKPDSPDGFNVILSTYADALRAFAKAEKVELVDVYALYVKHGDPDKLLSDGMHPNEQGHRLVADALIPLLTQPRR
jgi:lysophospholipase L1-like esterase